MFVIFLSLLLFSAVNGIIFPGRCPKTPPTQYTDYRNMFPEDTLNSYQRYEVIFNIPFFEDKTSYIFRAPNMALNTIILDQGNELCGIQLNPSMNGDFKIRTYANSTKSNSSITIKSTLNSVDDTVICDARSESGPGTRVFMYLSGHVWIGRTIVRTIKHLSSEQYKLHRC